MMLDHKQLILRLTQTNSLLLAMVFNLVFALNASANIVSDQTYFVQPFGGYSISLTELDGNNTNANPATKTDISVEDGGTYGVMAGVITSDPGNMFLLFSHQSSHLDNISPISSAITLPVNINYFHVGGSLTFPEKHVNYFLSMSLGLSQLTPAKGYSDESFFSVGAGIGAEYEIVQNLSLVAEMRSFLTFINNDDSLFYSSKQSSLIEIDGTNLFQTQFNIGVKYVF